MATRIDETLNLDFDRILIDQPQPIYRWHTGTNKAGLSGEHMLHPSLIEPFKQLAEKRKAEGTRLYFPQERNNAKALKPQQIGWDGWRERAGLDWHWMPHTFRHTCLTNLFNDPKNPQAAICKLYRVSLRVALDTYYKVTKESMQVLQQSIEVTL